MISQPKISIVTVCYNEGSTIEKTILSVINQTYQNIEYIVVDGASTDNTMDYINKYSDHITTIISEKDKGIYDAYNKGYQLATGDYVQFLNANDHLVDDTCISQVVDQIIDNQYPHVVYGAVYHSNPVTGFLRRYNKEILVDEIIQGTMLPFPATFIQRQVLTEVGGFSLDYPILADYELISRIAKNKYCFKHMDGVFVSVFYEGGISTQYSNFDIIEKERVQIIETHFGLSYEKKIVPNESYYKKWIASLIYVDKGIADYLLERDIKNIAIFGCGETSSMISSDCMKHNINVHALIDNDLSKQGVVINGVMVESAQWLTKNDYILDAIVLGFEGYHEEVVKQQIAELLGATSKVKVISWRKIVSDLF